MWLACSLGALAALPTADFEPQLTLEAGAAVVVEVPVRLPARLPEASARLLNVSVGDGLDLHPDVEVVLAGSASRVRWALASALPDLTQPASLRASVTFEIVIEGPRRTLRRLRVRQRVRVVSTRPDDAEVDRALATYLPLPEASLTADSSPLPERPGVLRWAARHRLQVAARRADDRGRRAWAALAAPTQSSEESVPDAFEPGAGLDGPPAAAAPSPSSAPPQVTAELRFALNALASFDATAARSALDRAREGLARDRERPEPERKGLLARTLELQGCLQSALGREAGARQRWLQALSIVAELPPDCPVPWSRANYEQLTPTLAPERLLDIGRVALRPVREPDGLEVRVEVTPDAGRLATTVQVEVQPTPSSEWTTARAAVQHAQEVGIAQFRFEARGQVSPQVPVRVMVFDRAGVLIASEGTPTALYVPVPRDQKRFRVPTWVWWVAGGLAVAGGATAAAFALSDEGGPSEPRRGLGPIDIRF